MIKLYNIITGDLVAAFKKEHDANFFKNAYNDNSKGSEIDYFESLTDSTKEAVEFDNACKEAENYLNDSEYNIETQLRQIIGYHDSNRQHFTLSYLPKVVVAEPFENTFTVESFLEQINYI